MGASNSVFELAGALEGLELGFLALDRQWRVAWLNQRAAALLALDLKSAVGKVIWDVAPALRGTAEELAWRKAMEARTASSVDADPWRVTATPSPSGLVVVWTEQTRSRKTEAELLQRTRELEHARLEAENEKRLLQTVMEALPVGISVTDAQGGAVRSNTAFSRVWSGPVPQVKSVAEYGAFKARWVDTGKPLEPHEWASALVVEKGEPVVGQYLEIERFDGSRATVLNSAAPVRDAAGKLVGSAVSIQDVTELRRAQQALRESERVYRAIGETIDYGVWVCDPEGRTVYLSDSFRRLVGRTEGPSSSFVWTDVLHPDDVQRTVTAWAHCIRTGGQWDIELRFLGADGQYHPVLARGVAVRDEQGKVTAWAGINLDISRLKKTEQVLQEADQRKNEFLAMLSHELRNPLAPIRISTEVLNRAEPGSEQARRALAVIDRQSAQLARLVDDLLDVTRIAQNKIQLQPRRVELNELVRQTVEDQRPLFERAGVLLELEPAPKSLFLEADWNRLAQILGNLLQNAAKFTPRGGRTRVTLQADLAQKAAFIRVADTGVGMTAEMRSRLFQPFAQADTTLDRSKGGLGLGLSLVKSLVDLHGGEVTAHSDGAGKGSEFAVRLPLTVAQPLAPSDAAEPAQAKKARVLIIEDNVDAADSLREALEFSDHRVEVAYDGPRGLEKALEFDPDVVLCDLGLPRVDGYEVARRFRDNPAFRRTVLVALSGYALPSDVRRAKDAGFDRHLAKPPELEDIEALLAEVIG